MKDYFGDFLLNKNPVGSFASWLGDTPPGTIPTSHLKLHIFWLLAAMGLVFLSWKASKWHAGYQFAKTQQKVG